MQLMLVAVLLAAPGLAQTADPAPNPVAKEKKVCRAEGTTGTRFPIRTCHTKAEWDAIDQQNKLDVDAYRRQGASSH